MFSPRYVCPNQQRFTWKFQNFLKLGKKGEALQPLPASPVRTPIGTVVPNRSHAIFSLSLVDKSGLLQRFSSSVRYEKRLTKRHSRKRNKRQQDEMIIQNMNSTFNKMIFKNPRTWLDNCLNDASVLRVFAHRFHLKLLAWLPIVFLERNRQRKLTRYHSVLQSSSLMSAKP